MMKNRMFELPLHITYTSALFLITLHIMQGLTICEKYVKNIDF